MKKVKKIFMRQQRKVTADNRVLNDLKRHHGGNVKGLQKTCGYSSELHSLKLTKGDHDKETRKENLAGV